MRLDGRSVVGVFFGSAVQGSTTAGQEDMCGKEVNWRGRFKEEEAVFQMNNLVRFNSKIGKDGDQYSQDLCLLAVTDYGFGLRLLLVNFKVFNINQITNR